MKRPPTIDALRALAMLAETGNVSETARRLGVSQPVISKKLQVFKDAQASGAVLLRTEGRVELTEAARSVLPAVEELLRRYDRIVRYLQGEEAAPQALRIGSGSYAAEHYLPRAIALLRAGLEDCQIETQICRGRERIVGTARGAFDLAIVTHDKQQIRQIVREERLGESLLKVERLARHAMGVLARKDTEAGGQLQAMGPEECVPPARLADWELVGPDRQSGLRRQLDERLRGKSLYFVAEGGGWAAAIEYARQGLGAALVPLAAVESLRDDSLVSRRLPAEFDVTDYLLSRRETSALFLEQAKAAIKKAVCGRRSG